MSCILYADVNVYMGDNPDCNKSSTVFWFDEYCINLSVKVKKKLSWSALNYKKKDRVIVAISSSSLPRVHSYQSYKRRRQKVSANKELSHLIVKPCVLVGGQAGAHVARAHFARRCLSACLCSCANAYGIIHMCLRVIFV